MDVDARLRLRLTLLWLCRWEFLCMYADVDNTAKATVACCMSDLPCIGSRVNNFQAATACMWFSGVQSIEKSISSLPISPKLSFTRRYEATSISQQVSPRTMAIPSQNFSVVNEADVEPLTADGSEENDHQIEEQSETKDDNGRAYVVKYTNNTPYPLEVGEIVWIVKPEYRAPFGPFTIHKACSDDTFQLVKRSHNTFHPELVQGKYLKRDS
ncbi:hypothetical protein F4777DRAFT_390146 [Nemania sp. FL0916]|nr:hypothetical protein F4777DRAFT_390146 [Nemania sp. FL0916]